MSLKYSKDHIWVKRIDPTYVRLGITDFAKRKLGEIIGVEWPDLGFAVKSSEPIGTLESSKTVADIYAPLDGVVWEINPHLQSDISMMNSLSMEQAWMIMLKVNDFQQLDLLLTEEQYQVCISLKNK